MSEASLFEKQSRDSSSVEKAQFVPFESHEDLEKRLHIGDVINTESRSGKVLGVTYNPEDQKASFITVERPNKKGEMESVNLSFDRILEFQEAITSIDVAQTNTEQKLEGRNRPGGVVPEWSRWQTKVVRDNDGLQREGSVTSPDGTLYEIKEGEQFVVARGENGDYEAAIIGVDGKKSILRESLGLEKEKTETEIEGSAETREMKELNEKIRPAAEYLARLDRYAKAIKVDPDTGKITYEKPKFEDLTDEQVKKYQANFTELLRQFKDKNKVYLEKLRQDPAILDVQEVAGAIVATYDSSKATPIVEGFDTGKDRGNLGTASEKYLGLAIVDINKDKRKDGVSPSTSAQHELNHYALSVSDYLISKDENIGMQSAYRKGRPTALYGSGRDRITTDQAILHDRERYSAALGREFDPQADGPRVETQSRYLDELHSSYLQRKEDWFNAQEGVYSTRGEGKHWELVGDHPDDIVASKTMLGYLQGFYTMDKIKDSWQQRLDSGGLLGEGQKKFLKECEEEFRKVGGIIGTARTVKQAEAMVAQTWKSFIEKNPRIAQTSDFQTMIDGWEKGAGVENIREILLGKTNKGWRLEKEAG